MLKNIPPRVRNLVRITLPPRMGGRFTYLIDKWIECNGLETTCKRLKALHVGAIQLRAGNTALARSIFSEAGIAWNQGRLKGPCGFIVLNFVRSEHPPTIRKWHSLLRVYTLLRVPEIASKHVEDAKSSICYQRSFMEQRQVDYLTPIFEEFIRKQRIQIGPLGSPNLSRLHPFSATHREVEIGQEGACKAYAKHTASMLTSVWIPPSLQQVNPAEKLRLSLVDSGSNNTVTGHISGLLEGGCKVRMIAVPNVWCQWLMEPLHKALSNLVRRDKNSCVFDQNAGAHFLNEALRSKEELFCYDLSSATDTFPLPLQEAFLRGIGLETYADAIHDISHGKWNLYGNTVSYSSGQPMGLYGSFPLFHITHVYLLRFLGELASCTRSGMSFMVLGDDVIIKDRRLARAYHGWLTSMGVRISESKSVTSSTLGQFAGFTAVNTTVGPVTYRPFKWNSSKKRESLANTCYGFGKVIKRRGPKWAQAYDRLSRTWHLRQPDLSPIVNLFDLLEGKSDCGLDSYFLGSLVNRISYELPFSLNSEFDRLWPTQVYLLLGQEEILSDDPGLDVTSDPRAGGWTIQDRNRNFNARCTVDKPDPKETDEFADLEKDPVVRQSEQSRSTKVTFPMSRVFSD